MIIVYQLNGSIGYGGSEAAIVSYMYIVCLYFEDPKYDYHRKHLSTNNQDDLKTQSLNDSELKT